MSSPATTGVLAALSWAVTLGTLLGAGSVAFLLATAPAEKNIGWSGLPLAIGLVIGLYVMAGAGGVGLTLACIGLGTAQTTAYRRTLLGALAINVMALVGFLIVYVIALA